MSALDGEQLEPSKPSSLESPKLGIDFNEPVVAEPAAEPERTEVTLTTYRRELWAFYFYYVVRSPQITVVQSGTS